MQRASVVTACWAALVVLLLVVARPVIGQTDETARNVVLFIGDGVDDHQLTIARNYLVGADGVFVFETFEHQATAKVLTVLEEDPRVPEYVGDSASGGTAIAAGVVTSRGRIATRAALESRYRPSSSSRPELASAPVSSRHRASRTRHRRASWPTSAVGFVKGRAICCPRRPTHDVQTI